MTKLSRAVSVCLSDFPHDSHLSRANRARCDPSSSGNGGLAADKIFIAESRQTRSALGHISGAAAVISGNDAMCVPPRGASHRREVRDRAFHSRAFRGRLHARLPLVLVESVISSDRRFVTLKP